MIFSNEELIDIIEEVFKEHNYDEIVRVPRKKLETPEGQIKWRKRNGISAAIKKGFLIQVAPGTQEVPFAVRINPNALQVIDRVSTK